MESGLYYIQAICGGNSVQYLGESGNFQSTPYACYVMSLGQNQIRLVRFNSQDQPDMSTQLSVIGSVDNNLVLNWDTNSTKSIIFNLFNYGWSDSLI